MYHGKQLADNKFLSQQTNQHADRPTNQQHTCFETPIQGSRLRMACPHVSGLHVHTFIRNISLVSAFLSASLFPFSFVVCMREEASRSARERDRERGSAHARGREREHATAHEKAREKERKRGSAIASANARASASALMRARVCVCMCVHKSKCSGEERVCSTVRRKRVHTRRRFRLPLA